MCLPMRWAALLLVASLFVVTSACRDAGSSDGGGGDDVQVDFTLKSEKVVGPVGAEVTLKDREGRPLDGADVSIRGDMTHAGMKPVLVGTTPMGQGRYATNGFQFTMGGDWIVTVEAKLPDGRDVQKDFHVDGVRG